MVYGIYDLHWPDNSQKIIIVRSNKLSYPKGLSNEDRGICFSDSFTTSKTNIKGEYYDCISRYKSPFQKVKDKKKT